MDDIAVFAAATAIFAFINRSGTGHKIKPEKIPAAVSVFLALLTAGAIMAEHTAPFIIQWYFPAAWALVIACFNLMTGDYSPGVLIYELLLIGAAASFLLFSPGPYIPYIFMISFFIILLLIPPAFGALLNGENYYPAFFLMIFSVFFMKTSVLGRLTPWISAPVSVLCAVFITVRKSEPLEYYAMEKNLAGHAGMLYAAFLIQCFFAAMLKNPFLKF
jgi:hypothetical protein